MSSHALALATGILLGIATNPLPIHSAVMMCPANLAKLSSGDHLKCPAWRKIIDEMRQET